MVSFDLVRGGRVKLAGLRALTDLGCELVFDSGAFQAWTKGVAMDVPAYVNFLRSLDAEGIPWLWGAAPDVIGDESATRKGWESLQSTAPDLCGKIVPVFHEGDSMSLLDSYEPGRRLIGLGRTDGRKSKKASLAFYDDCFNRHPDLEAHALGNAAPELLSPFPIKSFDACTWERGAAYSNALPFPYNLCSRESRMKCYVEGFDSIWHAPPEQLSLRFGGGK